MKTAIIGIGNILQKDDGVGVWIIQELLKEGLAGIEIVDAGTAVYDLISTFMENDRLIIVDSLKAGHAPGTIYRLSNNELKWREGKSSLHEVHFLDLLKMIHELGHHPEVTVFGIEPAEIYYALELSPEVQKKIPEVVELIKAEVGYSKLRGKKNARTVVDAEHPGDCGQ